jgi:hypothetical protein
VSFLEFGVAHREREERSFGGTELWVILTLEFFIFAVVQKERKKRVLGGETLSF